jgi:hypothetical protein
VPSKGSVETKSEDERDGVALCRGEYVIVDILGTLYRRFEFDDGATPLESETLHYEVFAQWRKVIIALEDCSIT